MMPDLRNSQVFLSPFPYGLARDVFPFDYYMEMVRRFPPVELSTKMDSGGEKWMLEGKACLDPFWIEFRESLGSDYRIHFSWLPAMGGHLTPHSDNPAKRFSMVVPIGQFDEAWGGESLILKFKDPSLRGTYSPTWDKFEIVAKMPFKQNTCSFFTKTENSWHGVLPCTGPDGEWRKSITINFQKT